MSADLRCFDFLVNRHVRKIVLGCWLGSESKKVSKDDGTDDHSEVTKKRYLSRCIARDICAQSLLQKSGPLPQLNIYLENEQGSHELL